MSQSCLCCSSFIPRLFHYTNMDVFFGLSIELESYCLTFMLYNQQKWHCLAKAPPPPMTTPLSPFPYSPPPHPQSGGPSPSALFLIRCFFFRFFFSCAQPQNLFRLGEGISRISRAAHQCVLCSFLNFRASGHQIPNI